MMRNKLILSILIFMFVVTAKSQNLKTFSGEFENGEPFKAKATYTYYEDSKTQAYIKHGSFKYSNIVNKDGAAFNATFNGNFKDNNKDGTWNFSVIETDFPHSDGLYYSGTIKLIANYSNGYPNGTWSYTKQMKRREKNYNGAWLAFESLQNETVTGIFKNGTLTGNFTTINNPIYEEYNNVTGQYDLNGSPIGKWIFKSSAKEKIIEFESGIVKNYIIRDITNGQIVSTEEVDEEMQKLKNDFVQGNILVSELAKNRVQVDTIKMVEKENGLLFFGLSFNDEVFKHRYIGGDLTYYYKAFDEYSNNYNQNTGWFDTRNYGNYLYFKKIKIIPLADISDYRTADNDLKYGNIKYAQDIFQSIIESYKIYLSQSDIQILNEKILECENAGILQQKTKELSDKFAKEKDKFVSYAKEKIFIENYGEQKWINATGQDNFDVKERNQNCITFISICSPKINDLYKKHGILKKNISTSIQKYEIDNDDFSVIAADYELFSKIKKEFETKTFLSIDTVSKLINSYNEVVLKLCNNVERKYITVSFSGGTYSTNYINKSLYNKHYSIVRDYLFEQLKQASSIEMEQKILIQINSLADKMISLINQDTNELEKQLKKAETPEDKLKIFTL